VPLHAHLKNQIGRDDMDLAKLNDSEVLQNFSA